MCRSENESMGTVPFDSFPKKSCQRNSSPDIFYLYGWLASAFQPYRQNYFSIFPALSATDRAHFTLMELPTSR